MKIKFLHFFLVIIFQTILAQLHHTFQFYILFFF